MCCGVSLDQGPINLPLLCDTCAPQPLRQDFNRGLNSLLIEMGNLSSAQQQQHLAAQRMRLVFLVAFLCFCLGLILKSLGL